MTRKIKFKINNRIKLIDLATVVKIHLIARKVSIPIQLVKVDTLLKKALRQNSLVAKVSS